MKRRNAQILSILLSLCVLGTSPVYAEDFSSDENCYEITTAPADFSSVRDALEESGLEFVEAEVQMVPTTYVSLSEADGEKMQRLIDNLEDLDDVMNVYHNWEQ